LADPRVSLGLPVYNGEKFLPRAIRSLLDQDYADFELVISDNASTDGTQRICEEFARQDKRIRYSRNERNIGLAPNHNRVFSLSQGTYFKWVAHDDEYAPRMLGRLVEVLDSAPTSVTTVYSACEYINERGEKLGLFTDGVDKKDPRPHRRLAHLLLNINIYNCTFGLIRSSALRKTRLHGSFPMADRVLFSELAMIGEIWELPEPLIQIRIHEGRSFTKHKTAQSLRELFDPGAANEKKFLSIEGRVRIELLRSAWRVPVCFRDKILCLSATLVASVWRDFKLFGSRQKRKLIRLLASTRTRSASPIC
jgi:glycosyltransferase involved in cell wall biosynthesis